MLDLNVNANVEKIDINNFKKIDFFSKDAYTETITVLYNDKKSRIVIEKSTEVKGLIKKGSHISVVKGEKANNIKSVIVIPAYLYNKMKQEQSRQK